MYYRVLIFLCLAISSVSFGFCQTNSDGIVDSQNRLAIIIDTTRPENSSRYKKALDSLIQTLNNTGINMSRIIVYSNICKQNEFKPTSTNIRALMNTIRNRNLKKLKNNNGNNITIRPNIDKLAELQIYLIAGGITNESQTRFMIIPSDVDEKNIKSTYDENLISIQNEIVDAMSDNAKANLFERTLLVINVNSVISVTRSSNHYSGASSKDINISYMSKTLKVHSNTGEENEEFEEDAKPRNFRSMLIITKNQSVSGASVENFFSLLKHGLEGYADISGNQDGIIQDVELADYIKKTNNKFSNVQVESKAYGNAPAYEICSCNLEIDIPAGLFKTIGETFTRDEYKALRDSAYEREKNIESQKKIQIK